MTRKTWELDTKMDETMVAVTGLDLKEVTTESPGDTVPKTDKDIP